MTRIDQDNKSTSVNPHSRTTIRNGSPVRGNASQSQPQDPLPVAKASEILQPVPPTQVTQPAQILEVLPAGSVTTQPNNPAPLALPTFKDQTGEGISGVAIARSEPAPASVIEYSQEREVTAADGRAYNATGRANL